MAQSLTIPLSSDELKALCWALDNYLPQLRYDEARVKLARNRHDLVVVEETLTALRERLGRQAAQAPDTLESDVATRTAP
jgi:hypothetical protein